ncbi:MAG: hypothetical protein FWG68_08775, partial [Defluviitaleaceae bacterium]|nr:hypothetical protein [Defluviitaleaceae bacterium]
EDGRPYGDAYCRGDRPRSPVCPQSFRPFVPNHSARLSFAVRPFIVCHFSFAHSNIPTKTPKKIFQKPLTTQKF